MSAPYDIDGTPGFSNTQLTRIPHIWQRVVLSPTNWYNTGAGGVAYVGAFSWSSDTPAAATPLVVTNSTSVSGSGVIERTADKDAFSFMTGAGAITLNVASPSPSPNLDIKAELYDSLGVLVASANPTHSYQAKGT